MNRRDALKVLGAGAAVSLIDPAGLDAVPLRHQGSASPGTRMRLEGGFIEYRNSMMNFGGHWGADADPDWMPYPIHWPAVLDSMRRIGMRTVIIKRMAVRQLEAAGYRIYYFYEPDRHAGRQKRSVRRRICAREKSEGRRGGMAARERSPLLRGMVRPERDLELFKGIRGRHPAELLLPPADPVPARRNR
jgi:hypothetical protein